MLCFTVSAFIGNERYVQEWVRNTNSTRVRYHSQRSPTQRAKGTPRRKLQTTPKVTPRTAALPASSGENVTRRTLSFDEM